MDPYLVTMLLTCTALQLPLPVHVSAIPCADLCQFSLLQLASAILAYCSKILCWRSRGKF